MHESCFQSLGLLESFGLWPKILQFPSNQLVFMSKLLWTENMECEQEFYSVEQHKVCHFGQGLKVELGRWYWKLHCIPPSSRPMHKTPPWGPTGRALIVKCCYCDTDKTYHFVLHKTVCCSTSPSHFSGAEFPRCTELNVHSSSYRIKCSFQFVSWTRMHYSFGAEKSFLIKYVVRPVFFFLS